MIQLEWLQFSSINPNHFQWNRVHQLFMYLCMPDGGTFTQNYTWQMYALDKVCALKNVNVTLQK